MRFLGMADYSGEQRRAFYRVIYPPGKRPTLVYAGRSYEIVDLCEQGIKIINKYGRIRDDMLRATIKFRDGETIEVVGKVHRVVRDQIVLLLLIGIPYKIIHREQIAIREQV
jgi:hypothetical protein